MGPARAQADRSPTADRPGRALCAAARLDGAATGAGQLHHPYLSAPIHPAPIDRASITPAPIDYDDIVVVAGATAALDLVATTLCDPGEAIVVPAPNYEAFDVDLTRRSECRLIRAPLSASDAFRLTAAALDRTLDQARRDGAAVKAVALTSPSHPLGQVYREEELREVLQVAAEHDVDVIADEIYANSVFGPQPFASMTGLVRSPLPPDRVHLVWGFAKDFGLAGFKVGLLHTTNPDVRSAARELARFAPVSTDTQAVLTDLLADTAWVDAYLAESRRRLGASPFTCGSCHRGKLWELDVCGRLG